MFSQILNRHCNIGEGYEHCINFILLLLFYFIVSIALAKMTAVEEQRQKCQRLQVSFSKILSRHMNNLFIHQVGSQMLHCSVFVFFSITFLAKLSF